jgi:hypothetical protein
MDLRSHLIHDLWQEGYGVKEIVRMVHCSTREIRNVLNRLAQRVIPPDLLPTVQARMPRGR